MVRLAARSADVGPQLDTLVVCAVATVLVIRLQLFLTNYPILGGKDIHIAHLLYGGLLMLAAIIIMLSFISQSARRVGMVIGGIGFGFFIDELGKFITSDNNYFFQPTAALIYLTFIVVYLSTRWLLRRRGLTSDEYVANALDLAKEGVYGDLDELEKRKALDYLAQADSKSPLRPATRTLLRQIPARPAHANRPTRWRRDIIKFYKRVVGEPWFPTVLAIFFIGFGIGTTLKLLAAILLLVTHGSGLTTDVASNILLSGSQVSVISVARLVSSLVSGSLVIAGLVALRKSRLSAYRWWEAAVLVSILITQVFQFADDQFLASFGAASDILILITLRYLIAGERHLRG